MCPETIFEDGQTAEKTNDPGVVFEDEITDGEDGAGGGEGAAGDGGDVSEKEGEETAEEAAERRVYEEIARKRGWVPRENYRGNPETFIEAKDFIDNTFDINDSYKKGNETLKRQIDEVRDSMRRLREHDQKVLERERNKHIEELQEARNQAIRDADVEGVAAIDKQISDVNDEYDKISETPEPQIDEKTVFADWQKNNDWYGKDDLRTLIADGIASRYAGSKEFGEILELMTKESADKMGSVQSTAKLPVVPENNETKRSVSSVESGSQRRSGGGGKKTVADMSQEQRAIFENLKASGMNIDPQKYVDELQALGEI